MCIIIAKNEHASLPSLDILQTCFYNNPDGAGLAIVNKEEKQVEIFKGFMDCQEFIEFTLEAVKPDTQAYYHFRIGTSGGIIPENCHPFPITNKVKTLKKLHVKTTQAFIHNGILGRGKRGLSDTQLYVMNNLYTLREKLDDPSVQARIEKDTIGSRCIIIDAVKDIALLTGRWIKDKPSGLLFSNSSYMPYLSLSSYAAKDDDEGFSQDESCCPECGGYEYKSIFNDRTLELFECEDCGAVFKLSCFADGEDDERDDEDDTIPF